MPNHLPLSRPLTHSIPRDPYNCFLVGSISLSLSLSSSLPVPIASTLSHPPPRCTSLLAKYVDLSLARCVPHSFPHFVFERVPIVPLSSSGQASAYHGTVGGRRVGTEVPAAGGTKRLASETKVPASGGTGGAFGGTLHALASGSAERRPPRSRAKLQCSVRSSSSGAASSVKAGNKSWNSVSSESSGGTSSDMPDETQNKSRT